MSLVKISRSGAEYVPTLSAVTLREVPKTKLRRFNNQPDHVLTSLEFHPLCVTEREPEVSDPSLSLPSLTAGPASVCDGAGAGGARSLTQLPFSDGRSSLCM